jgi:hypothetical protein
MPFSLTRGRRVFTAALFHRGNSGKNYLKN